MAIFRWGPPEGRAQVTESLSVRDQRSTTVPRNQPTYVALQVFLHVAHLYGTAGVFQVGHLYGNAGVFSGSSPVWLCR